MLQIGIDAISFYVSPYYLDLALLAQARGVDPEKFTTGLGQYKMAIPAPDEDVVTLGANAAAQVLKQANCTQVDALFFATESGIDQSKAAGLYVHKLLGLPANCRVVELKQACYSAAAAVQMAVALVQRNPNSKILVIAADISRYGLNTRGESSQGCGAVAMLITANPHCLVIEPYSGVYTEEIMDFWRPNYRDEAIVEGKFSAKMYLHALEQTWLHYQSASKLTFTEHDHYCFHVSVPRLVEKAYKHLAQLNQISLTLEQAQKAMSASLRYNREVGNCYTAALFISLISLLESNFDYNNKRIGFYSYGSGCVAEFFSAVVQPNYRTRLKLDNHLTLLAKRQALTCQEYEHWYSERLPEDGALHYTSRHSTGLFRLKGIQGHQRLYEQVS